MIRIMEEGRGRLVSQLRIFKLNCNPFSILGGTDSMLAAALLAVVNSMKSSFFPSRLPDVGTLHLGFPAATLTVLRRIPDPSTVTCIFLGLWCDLVCLFVLF